MASLIVGHQANRIDKFIAWNDAFTHLPNSRHRMFKPKDQTTKAN
jgi:hypothetical protein